MPNLFPPGDMDWKNNQPHSAWREFGLMLNQIKRTIEPSLSLSEVLQEWQELSKALAERPRQRKVQLTDYFEY